MNWHYLSFTVFGLSIAAARADSVRVAREVFADPESFAIVRQAERVELSTLGYNGASGKKDDYRSYTAGKFIQLDHGSSALFIWKLTEDSSFLWDTAIDANPQWHARARFWKGAHFVTVDMSFDSDLFVFSRDGRYISDALCPQGAEWLFQVVEEVFPNQRPVIDAKRKREERRRNVLQYEKARALELERRRANQSLEPTPTAVTPRADARVAPAVGVAHH